MRVLIGFFPCPMPIAPVPSPQSLVPFIAKPGAVPQWFARL
jgi:hypothetical protein